MEKNRRGRPRQKWNSSGDVTLTKEEKNKETDKCTKKCTRKYRQRNGKRS